MVVLPLLTRRIQCFNLPSFGGLSGALAHVQGLPGSKMVICTDGMEVQHCLARIATHWDTTLPKVSVQG